MKAGSARIENMYIICLLILFFLEVTVVVERGLDGDMSCYEEKSSSYFVCN
jgi:hypothetical protein